MKNNYKTLAATLALLAGVAVALPAFALDNTNGTVPRVQKQGWGQGGGPRGQMMGNRGVFGTVASINGNALTVTGKVGPNGGTPTTYTIDTTNAKVTKSNVASTVSAIAVGDTVMVQGTVSGTNIAATIIRDLPAQAGGIPNAASMMSGQNREKEDDNNQGNKQEREGRRTSSSTPFIIQGNGQPIVGGKVTGVTGNTVTISNASNVTYTVDATNAKIDKNNAVSTVGAILVGDNVIVQGAINGTNITASSIVDRVIPPASQTNNKQSNMMSRMFDSIGGLFGKLFGF